MKNYINLFLTLCSIALSINAYEFNFFNETNTPIGIAIQYTGNDSKEPLYKLIAKPKEAISFTPGVNFSPGKPNIPAIKWGFCLDNIYYLEDPKAHDLEKATWKKISITWVEARSVNKKLQKKDAVKQTSITPPATEKKSLCRDRHFDIIRDAQGSLAITTSLND